MKKLIIAHIRRRLANYVAVCVELAILLIVGNVLLNQLIPFIEGNLLYDELGLSKVFCCTINGEREELEALAEEVDATVLWQNYNKQWVESEEKLFIQPIEKEYLRRFHLLMEEELSEGCIAIVPESLSTRYRQGENYTVVIDEVLGELTFTVAVTLDNDLMFTPPAGDSAINIIGGYPHTILLAMDEETLARFPASNTYTLEVVKHAQSVVDEMLWDKLIIKAMSCEDAKAYSNELELSQMGMPIIISVVAIVLCVAGMLSNTLLSIIENERINGIYYSCGYTWKKCALIQIISDLLAVAASAILALMIMEYLSSSSSYIVWQREPFLISLVLVITIYVLTETLGVFQFKKHNVAEIAERMK